MPSAAMSPDIKLNSDTIPYQVRLCIDDYCTEYNLDLSDYKTRSNIKHLEVANILRYVYNKLFKPSYNLPNNQKSIVDYSDNNQLYILADTFINICTMFNKSLGLYWFSRFIGCEFSTFDLWYKQGEANPERIRILNSVKEYNRDSLLAILKDNGVGALAVANNDNETGLNWNKQNAALQANNSVFLLPSERLERLRIEQQDQKAPV